MNFILQILSVIGLGGIFFWAAIPTGIAYGLSPILTALLTSIGGIVAVFLVVILIIPIKRWLHKKFQKQIAKLHNSKAVKVWGRYGVIGLGLFSPLILGAPQCTLLGLILGAKPSRMFLWASLGCILWAAILTTATALGIHSISAFLK